MPDAPLFVSRNSTKGQKAMVWLPIAKARISPRQVQRDFKKWVKESGIESNLSPHSLRHTVGTRLLTGQRAVGWPPMAKAIAKAIGHSVLRLRSALMVSVVEPSDVATTLRYYVDVFPEDLEEAVELLMQRQFNPYEEIFRCYTNFTFSAIMEKLRILDLKVFNFSQKICYFEQK